MYDIFTRDEISTGQLKQIGDALDYDFFSLYIPEVAEPTAEYRRTPKARVQVIIELDGRQTTLDHWIDTLKKFNALI